MEKEGGTLHEVVTLPGGERVRRCGVCDVSGIEPAPETARSSTTGLENNVGSIGLVQQWLALNAAKGATSTALLSQGLQELP